MEYNSRAMLFAASSVGQQVVLRDLKPGIGQRIALRDLKPGIGQRNALRNLNNADR